jgi:peroxin-1
VRVAKIGQEIDVWVLGRTRVRLKVGMLTFLSYYTLSKATYLFPVSLDPQSKNNALLLSTNTEVSIAPKLHSRQQKSSSKITKDKSSSLNGAPAVKPSVDAQDKPETSSHSYVLRVLPERVLSLSVPSYTGSEILGYVSPRTFASLYPSAQPETSTYWKSTFKRLRPPIDHSDPLSTQETIPTPAPKLLNPGEKDKDKLIPVQENGEVFICSMVGIVDQHVMFPSLPSDVEDWDLVR